MNQFELALDNNNTKLLTDNEVKYKYESNDEMYDRTQRKTVNFFDKNKRKVSNRRIGNSFNFKKKNLSLKSTQGLYIDEYNDLRTEIEYKENTIEKEKEKKSLLSDIESLNQNKRKCAGTFSIFSPFQKENMLKRESKINNKINKNLIAQYRLQNKRMNLDEKLKSKKRMFLLTELQIERNNLKKELPKESNPYVKDQVTKRMFNVNNKILSLVKKKDEQNKILMKQFEENEISNTSLNKIEDSKNSSSTSSTNTINFENKLINKSFEKRFKIGKIIHEIEIQNQNEDLEIINNKKFKKGSIKLKQKENFLFLRDYNKTKTKYFNPSSYLYKSSLFAKCFKPNGFRKNKDNEDIVDKLLKEKEMKKNELNNNINNKRIYNKEKLSKQFSNLSKIDIENERKDFINNLQGSINHLKIQKYDIEDEFYHHKNLKNFSSTSQKNINSTTSLIRLNKEILEKKSSNKLINLNKDNKSKKKINLIKTESNLEFSDDYIKKNKNIIKEDILKEFKLIRKQIAIIINDKNKIEREIKNIKYEKENNQKKINNEKHEKDIKNLAKKLYDNDNTSYKIPTIIDNEQKEILHLKYLDEVSKNLLNKIKVNENYYDRLMNTDSNYYISNYDAKLDTLKFNKDMKSLAFKSLYMIGKRNLLFDRDIINDLKEAEQLNHWTFTEYYLFQIQKIKILEKANFGIKLKGNYKI